MEKVINVTMEQSESISHLNLSYADMARTIAEHMVKSRGDAEVAWKPYIKQQGISYEGHCRDIAFDGKAFYPEAKPGDALYTACNIFMEKDYELWINAVGCVQIFLDGNLIFSSWEKAKESEKTQEYISIPVDLKKGINHKLVIKCVCTEESFGYRLNLSPPRCPSLWANFYLFLTRVMLPVEGMEKEEGIAVSPLYIGEGSPEDSYNKAFGFEQTPCYKFPVLEKEEKNINFKKLYGEGNIAYAYTQAEQDGYLHIAADSPARIIINGEQKSLLKKGEDCLIDLKKGDEVLIKSQNTAEGWGFTEIASSGAALSFLDTDRKEEFTFLFCGPFYQDGFLSRLAPERCKNIFMPFDNGNGGKVFWRFGNAYLRAYLDSSFFGQWYYATMLSCLGILRCGEALDEPEFEEYFMKNQGFLAEWYEYVCYDVKTFGFAPFMTSASAEDVVLDHIGTMGVNFLEAYKRDGNVKHLYIAEKLSEQLKKQVSRFDDRTFCRRKSGTMWADDFYMSGPFMAELCSQLKDEECLLDIGVQTDGFLKRLYMPEEKIFSHIYFMNEEKKNRIPWGRGNGWIAFAMSEILMQIPSGSEVYKKVQSAFCEFCEGIAALQDESGLWHQVLNRSESYLETSCTAMFSLAFYRGVRMGWLPESYRKYADKGLKAILDTCVDKEGVVYGVCMGSSCSMDAKYYFELPSVKDDNHGTGVVMMLLCERMLHE